VANTRRGGGTLKKNFILDTNVLLHDPRSIFAFDDNNVVVPIYVIEEIDNFKRDLSSLGRNARAVARFLDEFRSQGRLKEGVTLGAAKGTIRVLFTDRQLPPELRNGHSTTDDRILAVALDVSQRERELPAVFVSKDTNLRIRADAMGLTAEDYDAEGGDLDELWSGVADVEVDAEG
jgi:PhoH-like ATPase